MERKKEPRRGIDDNRMVKVVRREREGGGGERERKTLRGRKTERQTERHTGGERRAVLNQVNARFSSEIHRDWRDHHPWR